MSATTEATTKQLFEPQRKWREKNPKAVWAQSALRSAVKRGIVTPRPCAVCGAEPAEAHHPDYDRPAEVVWLCRPHHKAEHRQGGAP